MKSQTCLQKFQSYITRCTNQNLGSQIQQAINCGKLKVQENFPHGDKIHYITCTIILREINRNDMT